MNNISERALQIAIAQLGQTEEPIGSNSGPMVDRYLASVGLGKGYAWCAAFVYWCYQSAAGELGVESPVVRTAGVHDLWNKTSLNRKLLKIEAAARPELILPGAQFILLFANGNGHTGFVEKVDGTTVHTIEGNSNNTGSREGYEVVRHTRALHDVPLAGFIRY